RILLCLIGSYFFYGWWDWRFLFLILFSTILDYIIGHKIYKEKNEKKRKTLLIISLLSNLGLLFYFKYFNFFIDSFIEIATTMGMSPSIYTLQIILPVGISFYTFQTLSYTIDIYKNKLKPESDFMVFATFVAFFPQLVAGPIVRAIDLLPQFKKNHRITYELISKGLFLIILGYFKKIVVADSLAPLVDDAFANPSAYTSLYMMISVVFYAFQIYCDFSGYSDIAIGLGKMMGYNFPINFNLPYLAKNFSDFWKRWHISLSSWLRDYLYIPLGGNRKNIIFTQRNLMITMLLGGLWHGANWTFVIWGFLHGLYLILQRLILPINLFLKKIIPKPIVLFFGILITFIFVNIAWIFFRSQNISQAFEIIEKILSFEDMSFSGLRGKFVLAKSFFVIAILFFGELSYFLFTNKIEKFYQINSIKLLVNAFLIWMILLFGTFSNNNFIYFQF
ncbi:UNVERIFIED_CONTAM: hypothetical protein GTU68_033949, partial [Idotea baltica]|nr:hypothetical protein [Idotea baltica]